MNTFEDRDRPIGHANTPASIEDRRIPWIWEGVIAEEGITLLSAPEKIGKTTLLSLLLDRRRAGGQLLGRTVYPGRTILCSEENKRLWNLRQPPLDFGDQLIFHQPEDGCPTRRRWRHFIDDLATTSMRDSHFDLLVIDTAVNFLPLADRNKRTLRWALEQLRFVADYHAGVLVVNQSRNVHRPLAAFADIVIDMTIPRGQPAPLSPNRKGVGGEGCSRRRIFTGVGRYPDTLQSVAAELNPEGTDYMIVPDGPPAQPPLLGTVQTLLAASAAPLTRRELLERWPGPPPREDSLWRTLTRGIETGVFTLSGSGTKTDAFRYGLRTAGGGDVGVGGGQVA